MERRHVAGVVHTYEDGITVEKRLARDGITWEKKTHQSTGMDTGWRKTREKFKAPKEWLEAHKDWQVTMTPALRNKNELQRGAVALVCLVLVVIFWKFVVGVLGIIAAALGLLLAAALSRGRGRFGRRY